MTTSMQPLYAITDAYQSVVAKFEDSDCSVEDVVAELQAIAGDFKTKAEAIACVDADLARREEVCAQEAKRLADRAKHAAEHRAWLRQYLLDQMHAVGIDHIDTPRFSLAIHINPPACVVVDAAAVPSEFQRTTISIAVDKRSVLEAVRNTGEIPAGVEIRRGEHLAIS